MSAVAKIDAYRGLSETAASLGPDEESVLVGLDRSETTACAARRRPILLISAAMLCAGLCAATSHLTHHAGHGKNDEKGHGLAENSIGLSSTTVKETVGQCICGADVCVASKIYDIPVGGGSSYCTDKCKSNYNGWMVMSVGGAAKCYCFRDTVTSSIAFPSAPSPAVCFRKIRIDRFLIDQTTTTVRGGGNGGGNGGQESMPPAPPAAPEDKVIDEAEEAVGVTGMESMPGSRDAATKA